MEQKFLLRFGEWIAISVQLKLSLSEFSFSIVKDANSNTNTVGLKKNDASTKYYENETIFKDLNIKTSDKVKTIEMKNDENFQKTNISQVCLKGQPAYVCSNCSKENHTEEEEKFDSAFNEYIDQSKYSNNSDSDITIIDNDGNVN